MNKKKRTTLTTTLKKYRKDKTHPKRLEGFLAVDRGAFEERLNFSLPEEAELETSLIPKEKQNPNAFYVIHHPIIIVYYLDSGKCFVYSEFGKFLGSLEKQDLKKVFSKIGRILRLEK